MAYKSFKDYLLMHDLTGKLSAVELKELQKDWRRMYQKKYHENYGKKRIRRTISLTKKEDQELQKAAKKHQKKCTPFIKECLFAYLNKQYLVHNESTIHESILQVRKVGTLINQIARHINTYQKVEQQQLKYIYDMLKGLEKNINEKLCHPPNLIDYIKEVAPKNLNYSLELIKIIEQHKPLF